MRRASAVLLLFLALAGCGDQTSAPEARNSDPSPSASTSEVPGTRPTPTSTPSQTPSSPAEESLKPTASSIAPEPANTSSIPATDDTLAGYRALAQGLTSLIVKSQEAQERHPDANPEDADDVMRLIGDVFPPGVELVVFAPDGDDGICLSGPATTYLLLDASGDDLRQSLGVGACGEHHGADAMTDADIVVDIGFEWTDDGSSVTYKTKVLKGQNLVDRIPGFGRFVHVLNDAT